LKDSRIIGEGEGEGGLGGVRVVLRGYSCGSPSGFLSAAGPTRSLAVPVIRDTWYVMRDARG
jgi:hypothetical protein